MANHLTLLGVSGSTRPSSFNTRLLSEASTLLPPGVNLVLSESLAEIPLTFSENETEIPAAVKKFQQEIKKADGIMFSTPQFNYNIPTTLRVAISWAQKAGGQNAWAGKPAAVIGSSVDTMGTLRAQEHLHQLMLDLQMRPFDGEKINLLSIEDKTLPDYRDQLQKFLKEFVEFMKH